MEKFMYKYKVEEIKIKDAEGRLNELAAEGWRVVSVTANPDARWQKDFIIVIFEKELP